MIWIISALVFAAGCLAVAIWALREMYRHKRAYAIASKNAMEYVQERNALKAQIEQYGRDAIDQAKRVDRALQERDSLRLQLDEALKPKARTSRAKPQVGKEEV